MVRMSQVMPTDKLKGMRVVSPAEETLGKIEDFAIDMESGCIRYAVLSFGGVLGIGDKLFAIPWKALCLSGEEEQFVLDVDREELENAPGFNKDNWPDLGDWMFASEIYTYYGYQPYWSERDRAA